MSFSHEHVVPLMNVGVVSTKSVADGNFLPNLVLDVSNHPEVAQYFSIHENANLPGDVETTWACITTNTAYSKKGDMCLIIEVTSPTQIMFGIIFEMEEHYVSVDQIIRTKAIYLQSSSPLLGKHVNLDSPRILIEVGAEVPFKDWEKRLHKTITKKFSGHGVKRKKAKVLATKYINEFRQFASQRLK